MPDKSMPDKSPSERAPRIPGREDIRKVFEDEDAPPDRTTAGVADTARADRGAPSPPATSDAAVAKNG